MRARSLVLAGAAVLVVGAESRGQGQGAPAAQDVVYRREVFRYPRGNRPDPFRPLVGASSEVAARSTDLALRGIVFSPDRGAAVAVVVDRATNRTYRLRVGQRLGPVTVLSIQPRQVQLQVQEVGATRREVLTLPRAGERGAGS